MLSNTTPWKTKSRRPTPILGGDCVNQVLRRLDADSDQESDFRRPSLKLKVQHQHSEWIDTSADFDCLTSTPCTGI